MNKRVCMFVWNHFTNDARVMRECSTLAELGYDVDLIAIHSHSLPYEEMLPEGFKVIRVRNRFLYLNLISGTAFHLKKIWNKHFVCKLLICTVLAVGLFFFPLRMAMLLLMGSLMFPQKLRTAYLRMFIALQMIAKGISRKYDIYHSNDLNTLPQGYICARILKKRKWIYDSHEVQTSRTGYNSPLYGIAEKFFVKQVDVMITENHTRAQYSEQLYGFYPKVLHNYPIPSKSETKRKIDLYSMLNVPVDEPILLYQGGIQIGRGLDKLIQAVPLMDRGVVVLIGDGRLKPDLVKMVAKMNLEDRVKFLPKVPLFDLHHYTQNAYLGFQLLNNICFNHYSASSNKLFEYIMSTVPVVACSFPEIQRVVTEEEVGVCVDSHSPASIAEGVNHLLRNPDEHKKMQLNCLQARSTYNWLNEKEKLIEIYALVS